MVWPNWHVLVTGGCGFIGSHLVEALVSLGATVDVVDDLRTGSPENLGDLLDRVALHQWDVTGQTFAEFVDQCQFDVIFHLASNAYVPPSVEDPWMDFESTLVGTLKLLEKMRSCGSQARLVYASSAAVYGNPARLPVAEQDPTVPVSPYGVSKLAAERYVHVYSQLYGVKAASLRLFSVYGPRQSKQVVYDFICKLDENPTELSILGDGQQVRDFSYVKDVAKALMLVAVKGKLAGEVYNVASNHLCTIEELAKSISRVLDVKPTLVFDDKVKSGRAGDPARWSADTRKLRQLGFEPDYSLERGLEETIKWFRSEKRSE